jgi:tRNA dimethylallyltransferase
LHTISLAAIIGPTGAGKSRLAIELAERIDAEIVGADSVQVYKYMDIGSAKPTREERACITHHLIDVAYPDESFDAARYKTLAGDACKQIAARGKRILVVGGTGLYIKALLKGLFEAPPVSLEIRLQLAEQARKQGGEKLFHVLQRIDPDSAAHIHPHDTYRIMRALEIYEQTGKPISLFHRKHHFEHKPYRYILRGLQIDRKILYERIERRVDLMVEQGLVEEVEKLMVLGYGPELKSMQTIGYRHMALFLQGKMNFNEAVRTCKRDTRRFAKRQLTWFQAQKETVWIDPSQMDVLYRELLDFFQAGESRNG